MTDATLEILEAERGPNWSQVKEEEEETEELQRELAEREFVSNAAHELRNPIAGISGAIEVLQSGAIGAVKRIHVWVPTDWHATQTPTDTPPVPNHIHWDQWIGPAPKRAYHPEYHPFKWRRWWDFSNGALGDIRPPRTFHVGTPGSLAPIGCPCTSLGSQGAGGAF